jgi:hypothetical protein
MTDSKTTKIALTQIASLEQALDELPARSTTDVGKGTAIGILAPKLDALRAKGYAWRDIAAWLTEHGVTVTAGALQRYLRDERNAAAKRDKGRATNRRQSSPREGASPSSGAAAVGSGTAPAPAVPKTSPPAMPVHLGARSPDRPSSVPRRDTDKI